jgi:hypothetical protein
VAWTVDFSGLESRVLSLFRKDFDKIILFPDNHSSLLAHQVPDNHSSPRLESRVLSSQNQFLTTSLVGAGQNRANPTLEPVHKCIIAVTWLIGRRVKLVWTAEPRSHWSNSRI